MVQEHPLVQYVEDPFMSTDIKGFQGLLTKIKNANSSLMVGVKQMVTFGSDGDASVMQGIKKISDFTQFNGPDYLGTDELKSQAQLQPSEFNKNASQLSFDSANKEKFTPHCINISRSPFKSVS